jgi:hypothetical protein
MLYLCPFPSRHFTVCFCPAFGPADAALIMARLGRLAARELTAGSAGAYAFPLQRLPLIDPGRSHLGLDLIRTDCHYKSKKSHYLFHVYPWLIWPLDAGLGWGFNEGNVFLGLGTKPRNPARNPQECPSQINKS